MSGDGSGCVARPRPWGRGVDGASARVSLHYVLDPWVLAARPCERGGITASRRLRPEGDLVGLEPPPALARCGWRVASDGGEVRGLAGSPGGGSARRRGGPAVRPGGSPARRSAGIASGRYRPGADSRAAPAARPAAPLAVRLSCSNGSTITALYARRRDPFRGCAVGPSGPSPPTRRGPMRSLVGDQAVRPSRLRSSTASRAARRARRASPLQPVQMPFEARDRRQVHRGPRLGA